jgi:hypothetical protein
MKVYEGILDIAPLTRCFAVIFPNRNTVANVVGTPASLDPSEKRKISYLLSPGIE